MFMLNKANVQQTVFYDYDSCNNNHELCNKVLQVNRIRG